MKLAKLDDKWKNKLWTIALLMVMVISVALMLTICGDEGIDYDESYSFKTARDYTHIGIVEKIIGDFDTDVPLYYNALRVWIMLFGGIGHRFFAARLFSVAGAMASMLLGITLIRKLWGNRTALYYMIAVGLAPAMLHVSINIRMYSWTNFLITASALLAYCIVQNPKRKRLWFGLLGCTVVALFSHYFTAFSFLPIYLYLLVALFIYERKQVWKVFACGLAALVPMVAWMTVSGFFHFVEGDGSDVEMKAMSIKGLLYYIFQTDMKFTLVIGVIPVVVALLGGILFMKNREDYRSEKGFALTSIISIFAIYLLALLVSSFASHFFSPRHIMHSTAVMWLGIAIILPRINWQTYVAGLAVLLSVCYANYRGEYELAYRDTPYLPSTKEFIAHEMEPGDIVIYTSPRMYSTLYSCYMPEQEFVWLKDLEDIDGLAGKRVWFFLTDYYTYFEQEDIETYGITEENMGHYGFQIMNNCTDFDILRVEIRGAE